MSTIPKDRYALIIGAMRSGTTSLYSYLVQHPQVCGSRVKEPEYFSENQPHGIKVDRYEDLWDFDPAKHAYALEASTGYTKFPAEQGVAERMAAYGIQPKFIYSVRNPFDRIESHYCFMQYKYSLPKDLSESSYIYTSSYFTQLEEFRAHFPRESFLILEFEDLMRDPAAVLTRICDFLGIPSELIPRQYEKKNSSSAKSPIVEYIVRSPVGPLVRSMPRPFRLAGKKIIHQFSPLEKRRLTQSEREKIYDALLEDMLRFQEEYGVDVGKWGFKK